VNAVKLALYVVAVLSSATCAVLLLRAYWQRPVRLLMWSGVCFIGLTLNNVALFADLVVFPELDLRLARQLPALIGMMFLLYGFIHDAD
jgi:hypothetical protein